MSGYGNGNGNSAICQQRRQAITIGLRRHACVKGHWSASASLTTRHVKQYGKFTVIISQKNTMVMVNDGSAAIQLNVLTSAEQIEF